MRAFIAHTYTTFIVVTCSIFIFIFKPAFIASSFILPTAYIHKNLVLRHLSCFFFFSPYLNTSIFVFNKYVDDQFSTLNPTNNPSKVSEGNKRFQAKALLSTNSLLRLEEILKILRNNLIFYARSPKQIR